MSIILVAFASVKVAFYSVTLALFSRASGLIWTKYTLFIVFIRRRCFYRQQYRHKRSWGDRSCYAVCKCNRCNNDVNQCRQRNYICCSSGQGGHREDLILPICWRTISKRLFLSSADTLTALRKILIYPSEIFILTTSLRKRMKSRSCAKNAQFQQARFLFDEAQ